MATFVYALAVLRVVGTGSNASFVPNNSDLVRPGPAALRSMLDVPAPAQPHHRRGYAWPSVLSDARPRRPARSIDRVYPDPARGHVRRRRIPPGRSHPGPVRTVGYRGEARGAPERRRPRPSSSAPASRTSVIELVPRFGELDRRRRPRCSGCTEGRRRSTTSGCVARSATGDERTMRQDPGLRVPAAGRHLGEGTLARRERPDHVGAGPRPDRAAAAAGRATVASPRASCATTAVRCGSATRRPTWEDYLSLALDETRHYGEGSVQVMRRLRALLDNVRESVPESAAARDRRGDRADGRGGRSCVR